jgi:hypothetical protein
MAFDVTITADKDGFIAELRKAAEDQRKLAKSMTGGAKAHHEGIAEGLELAAGDVERWDLLASFSTDIKLREAGNGQPRHAGAGYQAP